MLPTRPTPAGPGRGVANGAPIKPAPHHVFAARLKRAATVGSVVGFGVFVGLAADHVVGVTSHSSSTGAGGPAAQAAQPQITPAPFFGTQGGGSTAGNGGNLIVPSAPSLGGVGSGPIMRSGGS